MTGWPCDACPVQGTRASCCEDGPFLVTRAEWDTLAPALDVAALRPATRDAAERLRARFPADDWPGVVRAFHAAGERLRCPLLADDGRCLAYDRRPMVCRLYGRGITAEHALFACKLVEAHVIAAGGAQLVPVEQHINALRARSGGDAGKPLVAWLAEG